MSYADQARRQKPASMAAAVAVNGSIIVAIMLSPMVVNPPKDDERTSIFNVPRPKPPPPPVDKAKTDPMPLPPIYTPDPPFKPKNKPQQPETTNNPAGPIGGLASGTGTGTGLGGGEEIKMQPIIPPPPIFKKALRDRRFAREFQPDYPSSLLVREIEGSATVRVLIGTDGRVRRANVVSASHPDFGKAAVRQALKAWRFKPATRGDEAVEDWQTISVTFVIN
jgi:periplasmic protein TonB